MSSTSLIKKAKRVMRMLIRSNESGLTIVELVVVVGIGSVIILALVMMTTRAFDISRRELEQGAITEKARKEIERMSDEIRNAQYVDCNIDSDTADPGEHWLVAADDYSITLYSNVDDDVEAERVRYFVERNNPPEKKKLKRGVTQSGGTLCDFSGLEDVKVVMNGLDNVKGVSNSTPLFHYYLSGDDATELAVPVIALKSVLRVRMEMIIEESDINPDPVEITTDVVPRSIENPPLCSAERLSVKRYQYTSTTIDFADEAYNDCQSYCMGSTVLGPGQCCAWSTSFSWQGNQDWYVWAACQCEDTYLPPDLTSESVPVGGYTSFAKECLEGSRCGGQMGEPICNAGCLQGAGDCVCVCPAGWQEVGECDDGIDNDNDGTADCATCAGAMGGGDPGCVDANDVSENGTWQCDDGIDNDNDTFVDFKFWGGDPNCVSSIDDVECGPTEVTGVPQCNDGIDNECHGDGIDFSGSDPHCANDVDNNEWSLLPQCSDGLDNDGDGYFDWDGAGGLGPADTDCVDANDESEFGGGGSPSGPVYECSDGLDNDLDGNIDWNGGPSGEPADPDCIDSFDDYEDFGEPPPPPPPTYACSNGLDDDGDGFYDWDGAGLGPVDPECTDQYWDDESSMTVSYQCNNGIDDDSDGYIDFPDDPGCTDSLDDDESNGIFQCNNSLDDDGDFYIDFPDDPDCVDSLDNDESGGVSYQCNNGIDDDSDGYIDFPDDPGCTDSLDDDESNGIFQCNNSLDDDGDFYIDFPDDPDCVDSLDNDESI